MCRICQNFHAIGEHCPSEAFSSPSDVQPAMVFLPRSTAPQRIEWGDRPAEKGLFCLRRDACLVEICGSPIAQGEPFLDVRAVDLTTIDFNRDVKKDHVGCVACFEGLRKLVEACR